LMAQSFSEIMNFIQAETTLRKEKATFDSKALQDPNFDPTFDPTQDMERDFDPDMDTGNETSDFDLLPLTTEENKNINDLKSIEPAYANYSNEQVQAFIESKIPDSEVKEVVFHGSPIKNIETFNKGNIYFSNDSYQAFELGLEKLWNNSNKKIKNYFEENTNDTYKNAYSLFEWTLVQAKNKFENKSVERGFDDHISYLIKNNIIEDNSNPFISAIKVYPVLLSIKEPRYLPEDKRFYKGFKKEDLFNDGDAVIGKDNMPVMAQQREDTVYLVNNPSQIINLSSPETTAEFKEFVDGEKSGISKESIDKLPNCI
jgi:hypothetical protein